MSMDLHKGYPTIALEDSYEPTSGAGLKAGMFVVLDGSTGKLVKAVGNANEYAMMCATDQGTGFMEQGNKVQVIKQNSSNWTSYYKAGVSYTPHCKLQVSAIGGEEGILTIHAGAGAPVIGRFLRIETINNQSMMLFDLVRA